MHVILKYPYTKAAGISLIFHAVLLVVLVIAGNGVFTPATNAAPIELEFVGASVIDMGNTMEKMNSSTTAEEQHSEQPVAPKATKEMVAQQESSLQSQTSKPTVTQAAVTDGGTVGVTTNTASGDAGSGGTENKDAGQAEAIIHTQAAYVSGSRPAYPSDAVRAGWEGTVVIRVLVDTGGTAAAVTVRSGSGYASLDEAAVQAVKRWRFTPARQGRTTVESYIDVRVKFNLADAR